MKIFKFLYVLLLIVFLGNSCSEDFLDTAPLDKISSEDVWKDSKLVELYINGIYGRIESGWNRGWAWLAAATDDAENSYPWPGMQRFNRADILPSANPINNWGGNYASIRRCNDFFDNIATLEDDQEVIDRFVGEVTFLRALFYFELNRNYRGVPLITEIQGLDDDLLVSRSSFEEVMKFVIDECDKAIGLLPETVSGSNLGKATKGSATALKARAQLYSEDWAGAAATANSLINSGVYGLFPEFDKIWSVSNENNSEVIFDIQFQEPDRGHWANLFNTPAQWPGAGWGGTCPTQDLVDEFELKDGKLYTESDLYDENKPYDNRDPRFYASILYDGAPWAGDMNTTRLGSRGGYGANGDATKTGYYVRKMIDEEQVTAQLQNALSGSQNWIYFRLAEMYLIYAEAQNEASGPDPTVYAAVNKVRERVGMPPLNEGLSQEEMRNAIRHERRVELAFEEHRFWDARRWGIANEVFGRPIHGMLIGPNGELSGTGPNGEVLGRFQVEERLYDSKMDQMPIPQSEIDKNSNLTQNPGY